MIKKLTLSSALYLFCFLCFFQGLGTHNSLACVGLNILKINHYSPNDTILYKTFRTDAGWGYDIYVHGNLYIHQPSIPAIIGNNGFLKERQAIKTAKLVVKKIKDNIIPPTVSIKELKYIKVLK